MAIKEYMENGKVFYAVTVNVRSKENPSLRLQPGKKGIPSRAKAEKIEVELRREAEREIARREISGCRWSELVFDFHEHCEQQAKRGRQVLNSETLVDYIAAIRKWTKSWLNKQAVSISSVDVYEVLDELEAAGRSNDHQVKLKHIIHKIFQYGIDTKRIPATFQNPTDEVKLKRDRTIRKIGLTSEQLKLFLRATKEQEAKWYPLFFTALNTGMRNGELYALTWEDVDFENKIIVVRKSYNSRRNIIKTPKNGQWRNVPINSELEKLLKELRATSNGRTEVLPRMWQWDQGNQAQVVRKVCLSIGLPSDVCFHDLRAFFATELMRHGVMPIVVMKIAGWTDLKTMERYIRQAGIEVSGATKALEFLAPHDAMGKVVELFGSK